MLSSLKQSPAYILKFLGSDKRRRYFLLDRNWWTFLLTGTKFLCQRHYLHLTAQVSACLDGNQNEADKCRWMEFGVNRWLCRRVVKPKIQECIPVGCVPAERWPCSGVCCFPGAGGGVVCSFSAPGGVWSRGGVCSQGGGVWSGGGDRDQAGTLQVNRMNDRQV